MSTIAATLASGAPTLSTSPDAPSSGVPTSSTTTNNTISTADTRVRLRAMIGQEDQVYGSAGDTNNILSIMHPQNQDGTNGLLFPYTPTIAVSQNVVYKDIELVHVNSDMTAYSRTPSVGISVTGKFTIQNQREGRYALAVLHFLRTVSKMYFGETDTKAGTPPPVLVFTGYGSYVFNNLPVILKSHSYTFDDHADTVVIQTAGGVARLPSMFSVAMELTVQQTPGKLRKSFNLDDFRTGKLLRDIGSGTGWI